MKRTIWVALSLISVSLVSTSKAAMVADLRNDWSDTSNPNPSPFGTWSYRQGTSLLPEVPNFTFGGSGSFPVSQPAWAPSDSIGNFLPAELKARSTLAGDDFQVGDVILHTTDASNGDSHGPANFLWTSPITGTVTISGGVWAAATLAGRDNAWSLFVDGVLVSSGASIDGHDRSHPFLYSSGTGGSTSLVQNVNAGETIDLQVAKTTQFGFLVGVNLTITASAVPEPSSLILVGLGISISVFGTLAQRIRWVR